jgi:hypothetical protein
LRARRILRRMGTELDTDRVIADYAAGRPVGEIEAAYGLTRDEIEYLVADSAPARRLTWRDRRGNRVLLSIAAGWLLSSFAYLLGAEMAMYVGVWAIGGIITYAVSAPRD